MKVTSDFIQIRVAKKTKAKFELNIKFVIRHSLKYIRIDQVEFLRISFLEFRPSRKIMVSAQNQISKSEVKRLYHQKRYIKISFNDQLDSFYEKCLLKEVGTGMVHFFHTEKLKSDQSSSFADEFFKNEKERYRKRAEISKRKFHNGLKKIKQYEGDPDNVRILEQQYEFVQQHLNNLNLIHKEVIRTSKLPDFLGYNLFHGFRATIEFDIRQGKPSVEKIMETLKLMKLKTAYPKFLGSDSWQNEIRNSIRNDFNRFLAKKESQESNLLTAFLELEEPEILHSS